jgi:hypothetical protein
MTFRNDLGRLEAEHVQTHGPAIRAPSSTASVDPRAHTPPKPCVEQQGWTSGHRPQGPSQPGHGFPCSPDDRPGHPLYADLCDRALLQVQPARHPRVSAMALMRKFECARVTEPVVPVVFEAIARLGRSLVWTVLCGLGGGPDPPLRRVLAFKPSFHTRRGWVADEAHVEPVGIA